MLNFWKFWWKHFENWSVVGVPQVRGTPRYNWNTETMLTGWRRRLSPTTTSRCHRARRRLRFFQPCSIASRRRNRSDAAGCAKCFFHCHPPCIRPDTCSTSVVKALWRSIRGGLASIVSDNKMVNAREWALKMLYCYLLSFSWLASVTVAFFPTSKCERKKRSLQSRSLSQRKLTSIWLMVPFEQKSFLQIIANDLRLSFHAPMSRGLANYT